MSVSLGWKPSRPRSVGKQQTGSCTGGPKGSTQKSWAGRRWVALLAFISLAADNTHTATHGKETVYTECPYKYFQCTFYTQVTETFHSSVQSLGVPALSCRLGPKPKEGAHLLSPLAQPETSPAWAAAGGSRDALMETLCMALGLEPGRTVTLQTDRHSWGSQGDHPLPPSRSPGRLEGHLSRGCVGEKLPLHQHMGSGTSEGIPPCTGQKQRGAQGCSGETCTSYCPPPPHCTRGAQRGRHGREGRKELPKLPYCLGERVQQSPSPVPAVQGRATHLKLLPAPVLSTCVCGGEHRETASPPVPVTRTGCTGAPPSQ